MTRASTTGPTRAIPVRLSPGELRELDEAARLAGESRADYIRRAALDRARASGLADRVRAALGG